MAFSMHSHSGQFCPGHAQDDLETILQTAISKGFQSFAFTEHMPRDSNDDLYPEEIEAGHTIAPLRARHEAFIIEATRLREKYAPQIKVLIGFEGEWIRPSYSVLINELAANPGVDFFLGSVHHVHCIPIDYDARFYKQAREAAGGSDERLFEDYFDLQYRMLDTLKPKVVAHFDLIRLLSDEPDRDLRGWRVVWGKVIRNLKVVVEQGGLLEINSAALRKGLKEPYPGRKICEVFLEMGGRLTLSDDSHGVEQVGTNFGRTVEFLESLGVQEIWNLEAGERDGDGRRALSTKSVRVEDIKQSFRSWVD